MIKYTNISYEKFINLSDEERKAKPYFVEEQNFYPWIPLGRNYILGSISYGSNINISTYLLNDVLHKEDGPAKIYSNGIKLWYLNGKNYSFEEWLKLTPISDEEKILIKLKYS